MQLLGCRDSSLAAAARQPAQQSGGVLAVVLLLLLVLLLVLVLVLVFKMMVESLQGKEGSVFFSCGSAYKNCCSKRLIVSVRCTLPLCTCLGVLPPLPVPQFPFFQAPRSSELTGKNTFWCSIQSCQVCFQLCVEVARMQ